MRTFKNKITGIFWVFLFLAILLQLSASQVIPLTGAALFALCMVFTFLLYVRIISTERAKRFLSNANILIWIIAMAALSAVVAAVLAIEGYVIMKATMSTATMESVMEESTANFIGFFMISALISVLNYSFEKYKDYLEQERELEKLKRKALEMELSLLRNQLSPHFTFNILNNLQFLIRKDKEEALRLLERYSKILRYYVYESQKKLILLSEEIAFLKEYFDLEISRHVAELQISCDWNVPENDLRIVPFVLSTFVENAFKHVLPNHVNDYYIRQSCSLDHHDNLIFKITNTFDEEVMATSTKGLGLKHVEERLALAYPGRYRLVIQAEKELFIVRLELKLER